MGDAREWKRDAGASKRGRSRAEHGGQGRKSEDRSRLRERSRKTWEGTRRESAAERRATAESVRTGHADQGEQTKQRRKIDYEDEDERGNGYGDHARAKRPRGCVWNRLTLRTLGKIGLECGESAILECKQGKDWTDGRESPNGGRWRARRWGEGRRGSVEEGASPRGERGTGKEERRSITITITRTMTKDLGGDEEGIRRGAAGHNAGVPTRDVGTRSAAFSRFLPSFRRFPGGIGRFRSRRSLPLRAGDHLGHLDDAARQSAEHGDVTLWAVRR